nr:MAG TPA: hypothetical protein [Caudoviricetes sp.]
MDYSNSFILHFCIVFTLSPLYSPFHNFIQFIFNFS